jgi:hypothetical protein
LRLAVRGEAAIVVVVTLFIIRTGSAATTASIRSAKITVAKWDAVVDECRAQFKWATVGSRIAIHHDKVDAFVDFARDTRAHVPWRSTVVIAVDDVIFRVLVRKAFTLTSALLKRIIE